MVHAGRPPARGQAAHDRVVGPTHARVLREPARGVGTIVGTADGSSAPGGGRGGAEYEVRGRRPGRPPGADRDEGHAWRTQPVSRPSSSTKGDPEKTERGLHRARLLHDRRRRPAGRRRLPVYLQDRRRANTISAVGSTSTRPRSRTCRPFPAVGDVGVFGIPDEDWGEAVKAVRRAGRRFRADEVLGGDPRLRTRAPRRLQAAADDRLRGRAAVDPNGKVQVQLRDPYWAGRAPPHPEPSPTSSVASSYG